MMSCALNVGLISARPAAVKAVVGGGFSGDGGSHRFHRNRPYKLGAKPLTAKLHNRLARRHVFYDTGKVVAHLHVCVAFCATGVVRNVTQTWRCATTLPVS